MILRPNLKLEKIMNKVFIYPGSFCPPTYGHLHIVKTFVEQYELPLIIICSENPDKMDNWFTPNECVDMWKTYTLPRNVSVVTLKQFMDMHVDTKSIVMIRGLRNEDDAEYERKIMLYNQKTFGISQYLYIFGDKEYTNISSSSVRNKVRFLHFYDIYSDVSDGVAKMLWKFI